MFFPFFVSKYEVKRQEPLFPNPASDKIIVKSNEKIGKEIQLNIYNITGELVKSVFLQPYQQEVLIDDMSNGVYLVEMQRNENIVRKKLIIQR